ncbi:unnamed protein product [Sympodiomycopsis kandeliae]
MAISTDTPLLEYRVTGINAPSWDQHTLGWLCEQLDPEEPKPVVGLAISVRTDGILDGILLTAKRRLLIVKLNVRYGKPIAVKDHKDDAKIREILDGLRDLFAGEYYLSEYPVRVAGFSGAQQALYIAGATGLRCCFVDYSGLLDTNRLSTPFQRCVKVFGGQLAQTLYAVNSASYVCIDGPDVGETSDSSDGSDSDASESSSESDDDSYNDGSEPDSSNGTSSANGEHKRKFIDSFIVAAKESFVGYMYGSHHQITRLHHFCKVDSNRLSPRDLALAADMMRTFQSVQLLGAKEADCPFSEVKREDAKSVVGVQCEHFRNRLTRNTKQTVEFLTSDGNAYKGRTRKTEGKYSEVSFSGKASLPEDAVITGITIRGRGDADRSVLMAICYWRSVLSSSSDDESDASSTSPQDQAMKLMDPSGLFYPLFHGEDPKIDDRAWRSVVESYNCIPEDVRYTIIEESTLNESQKAAAIALAKPIEQARDRLVLIHGPPGTGKTTVIGEFAKQWLQWAGSWTESEDAYGSKSTMWCACQSNAATKNIADALVRAEVPFKILVSAAFYREWHEHHYIGLEKHVIVTDLLGDLGQTRRALDGVRVILSTLSGISSIRLDQGQVFRIRPLNLLLVDEASQLVIGNYPHVFAQHHRTLQKVVFLGDDRQLSPYGSDTLEHVTSVFELPHLREGAHMLKESYRLPHSLCDFISRNVYGEQLSVPEDSLQTALKDTVRFVDCIKGVAVKEGSSWKNVEEAELLVNLVKNHMQHQEYAVLTTYNAQRDLLEDRLRREGCAWQGRVFTADSFQGQEADVTLISLVRDGAGQLGFISNPRRANVLLSRCKVGMYLFTNRPLMSGPAKDTLVGKLIAELGEDAWCTTGDVLNGRKLLSLEKKAIPGAPEW